MSSINSADFTSNLYDLLHETFEGTGGQGSHYIDGKGHGSFLETLDRINHITASTSLKPAGATIAAHTEHTRYYLETLRRFIANEPDVKPDWAGSWRQTSVDAAQWEALKTALRQEYETTLRFFQGLTTWDDEPISGALSILAHCAYHLGAVRLMAVTLE